MGVGISLSFGVLIMRKIGAYAAIGVLVAVGVCVGSGLCRQKNTAAMQRNAYGSQSELRAR